MAFTTWAAELQRFRDAVASQDEDSILKKSITDSRGNRVEFKSFQDIQAHLRSLEELAATESNTGGKRTGFITAGYNGF